MAPPIKFKLPNIADPLIDRSTGFMSDYWYRQFELLETLAQGVTDDVVALDIYEDIEATEDVVGLVNIYDSSGTKVRLADATSAGTEANGYVVEAALTGALARVRFFGKLSGFSGLSPGFAYLSTTPGQPTSTPPSASGNLVQIVGTATSDTGMVFMPQPSTELV